MSEQQPVDDDIDEAEIDEAVEPDRVNWTDLQKAFDKYKGINALFYFLRHIVDILELCTNTQCEIYPELYKIDIMRMDFKYPSLEIAYSKLSKSEYMKFEKLYWNYVKECKKVFSRVFALKTSKDAQLKETKQHHVNFMDMLDGIAKGHINVNADVQKGLEEKVNEYASQTDILDERAKEQAKRFKEHMKNLKKSDKEKKDEKTQNAEPKLPGDPPSKN